MSLATCLNWASGGLPVDHNERRFVQRAGRDEIQPLLASSA
jgi:hypothetical protein